MNNPPSVHYRVRWEIDIEADNRADAARLAEAIMRTPVDNSRDQARCYDVCPIDQPRAGSATVDLADERFYRDWGHGHPDSDRARPWKHFVKAFLPVRTAKGEDYLVEPDEVPPGANERYWWTVVDFDPNGPRLYLVAGFSKVNRLGYVECLRPWPSKFDNPLYTFR
ncbi:hypothetical protein HYPGJ_31587 [Hyphomicrobium sp. GJ21]|uniref:hypothetical protein n=1 Tax=Hyphomicrobium sp. GJ21 TaxID=113574 RepID=UPI00041697BD|nr:hypothetical protein [Hyphomicrobium sp. GJ21]CEJ88090.1 hypothetical protein HYPGJ_31587 [Hyphomicrobium sp. GJ21]